ncbi:hypothetical protein FOVSG1_006960 [Fusarium oxysporum f. sp. vasinfectum]
MRLALLFGLIGSAKASGDYFEPFPTCADCLPASVHDAPGIGFSLSLSSGTAAVHFYNGTVKNIASIPANPEYAALMKRLANSPPPPPPSRWEKLRRSFNKKIGRPATPDVGIIATILVSLRDVTSIAVTSPLDRVAVSHLRIQGLAEPDLWDALEYAHIRPWVAAGLPRPKVEISHFGIPVVSSLKGCLHEELFATEDQCKTYCTANGCTKTKNKDGEERFKCDYGERKKGDCSDGTYSGLWQCENRCDGGKCERELGTGDFNCTGCAKEESKCEDGVYDDFDKCFDNCHQGMCSESAGEDGVTSKC